MSTRVNFIIETPVAEDYKQLHYVNKQTWLHTYPNLENNISLEDIESLPWSKFAENWKTKLTSPEENLYYLVAKTNNSIVGFIGIKELPEFISIGSLYILPDYQSLGIGSGLVHHALEFVSKEKNVVTKVAEYNKNAINFYKKLGFIYLEKISDFPLLGNKFIPQIKMILER